MYDAETNTYLLKGNRVSAEELIAYTKTLTEKFNFVFIEDLLDEEDWESYPKAHREITRTILLGDDFIVTNMDRLKRAYELQAIDGFILKPNQVGTLTEALDTLPFRERTSSFRYTFRSLRRRSRRCGHGSGRRTRYSIYQKWSAPVR